jgi:hypothetical protein
MSELELLKAEIEQLKSEVALLKARPAAVPYPVYPAHPYPAYPYNPWQQPYITCGYATATNIG